MKSRLHRFAVLLAGGIFAISAVARAGSGSEEVIPKGYPMGRYAPLWEHSPFVLASVTEPPAPGFAVNLAVVALAKIGDEDVVTVVNKQSQERITLDARPNEQGIKVVSVVADPDPLKAKVTLQKGSETATVSFDRALMAVPQAPAAPALTTANLNFTNPGANPGAPAPGGQPPNVSRRVIHMPPIPVPAAANAPANPAAAPASNAAAAF